MKDSHCDVIITYSWNRVGYNILRSLADRGLKVWTADVSRVNICSRSNYASGSFVYPDPFKYEDGFISCLKDNILRLKPKMLLPTHDESIVIMRHRDEFPANLIIPYSNHEMLMNLSDKAWSTSKAESYGIPVPEVYNNPDEVSLFPCIFKTAIGNSAKTVYSPNNREDLIHLWNQFNDRKVLIEEKIPGLDYSVDCIRWNGFFFSTVYRSLVTKTKGGGTSTQREIVIDHALSEYSKTLLDGIGFQGVCGLDFRVDQETGRKAFIEVNSRFTGGIATPISSGFDIPWILYSLATEGHFNDSIIVKAGTKTKWILGDIITLVTRLMSLDFELKELRQIMSFRGFDAYDDYRSDDKKAILGEFEYYLHKLIKYRKLNP